MLVELNELAKVIGPDLTQHRELSDVGPYVRQIFGSRADVIYIDVGQGCCEILSINPRAGLTEDILREVIKVSELEGGS
jgi:hypothetical protein